MSKGDDTSEAPPDDLETAWESQASPFVLTLTSNGESFSEETKRMLEEELRFIFESDDPRGQIEEFAQVLAAASLDPNDVLLDGVPLIQKLHDILNGIEKAEAGAGVKSWNFQIGGPNKEDGP